ncbi:MAG: 16S rRNA (cytosine(1402)-N(4))-methyltransferase RsmH [Patescibacteria group bacterium]
MIAHNSSQIKLAHTPVLLKEVIAYLDPQPGENFIDATFGGGGHAREILKKILPGGMLLGLDWDTSTTLKASFVKGFGLETRSESLIKSEPQIRSGIEPRSFENLLVEWGNFAEIEKISAKYFPNGVDGVLFDFGLSSDQLEASGRGFSYLKNEPLDMRFYRSGTSIDGITAAEIVNDWPEEDLARIFREYGEEKNAKRIARAVAEARKQRKILTTGELVEVLGKIVASNAIKTHSKIFQALRIAVNNELENIKQGLAGAGDILKPGGRIAAISFHSLEDRLVKDFFKRQQILGLAQILTKKPVVASAAELKANSRSRSAKLRVIKKK